MGLRRGAGKRGLAGLAVLGVVVTGGLLAAWGVSPVEPSELSPADVVSLRFPADWNDDETTGSAPAATSATFALASVSDPRELETSVLFSPYQTYPSTQAQPGVAQTPLAAVAPQPSVTPEPAIALVAAPNAEAKPIEVQPVDAKPVDAKPVVVASRSIAPAPERKPAPPRATLFNDAQLASIKARLKLSEYQQQYWPQVASALRAIGWRAAHEPGRKSGPHGSQTRLAEIDPDSAEVQQLKSAAFPLIMSMNEDQKREVRMLAHVMGLEQVASSF
jgi:hypothetical protein